MNTLERRLVELNKALLTLSRGEPVAAELLKQAQDVIAGDNEYQYKVDTGPGNDTVIINETSNCEIGYTGSQGETGYTGSMGYTGSCGVCEAGYTGSRGLIGYTGSQGDAGYTGSQGAAGYTGSQGRCQCHCSVVKCTSVDDDYDITTDDCYIGVNTEEPITLTLPSEAPNGTYITIKLEMDPPVGSRKVTLLPADNCFIDGELSFDMKIAYECIHLVKHNNKWNIVSIYY